MLSFCLWQSTRKMFHYVQYSLACQEGFVLSLTTAEMAVRQWLTAISSLCHFNKCMDSAC